MAFEEDWRPIDYVRNLLENAKDRPPVCIIKSAAANENQVPTVNNDLTALCDVAPIGQAGEDNLHEE